MKKAILHIDLHAPYYDPSLRGIFNRCAQISKSAREQNIENIWVGFNKLETKFEPMMVGQALREGLLPVFKTVTPHIDEVLLLKNGTDLFKNPHAITFFKQRAYDEIYITGVYAMGCVHDTIKGMFQSMAQQETMPKISIVIDAVDATVRSTYEIDFMPRLKEGRDYLGIIHSAINQYSDKRDNLRIITSDMIEP